MAGRKDPAFPLYCGDWLHDRKLRRISRAQRATLVDLWSLQWIDGPLPDDVEWLAQESRSPVEDVRAVLEAFFELTPAGWSSARLEAERQERIEIRRKRQASGSRGGKATSSK